MPRKRFSRSRSSTTRSIERALHHPGTGEGTVLAGSRRGCYRGALSALRDSATDYLLAFRGYQHSDLHLAVRCGQAVYGVGSECLLSGKTNGHDRPVVVWPLSTHAVAIVAIVVASTVNGYLLSAYTDAAFPYIDSLTTWSAIWATFLVARKVLENWWYWLVIDIASVLIYWSRDLQLTSVLFGIYVIMIPIGLISWTKSMHRQ
jgi:hypothetical protein